MAAVATYAWVQLAARLDKDPLEDLRLQYVRHGWEAVKAYLPWGSGAGSFRWTYAPFEPVTDMSETYALHAHNDLLELALELGLSGMGLALCLLFILAAMGIARHELGGRLHLPQFVMAVAVAVPLAHSLVDYPLRTLAVLVLSTGLVAALGSRNSLSAKNATTLA